MIIANKVNINYEYDLFNIPHNEDKINNELEYLYFLALDDAISLFSNREYSDDYLEHLKSNGFHIPAIVREASSLSNWWGSLRDRDLEQKLNSKLTSLKTAQNLGIAHPAATVVVSSQQVFKHIKNYEYQKWVLKNPFLFSGKGFQIFSLENVNSIKIDSELVLEPWLEKMYDFGTIIYPDGAQRYHWNLTDQSGAYKGTYIKDSGVSFPFEYPQDLIHKVAEAYRDLGARSFFSIDSMVYQDQGRPEVLPLVEVNYRKSIGYIAHQILQRLNHQLGLIFLLPSKKHAELKHHDNLIKLSPRDCFFSLFYIHAKSETELADNLQEIIKTNKLDYAFLDKFLVDIQG